VETEDLLNRLGVQSEIKIHDFDQVVLRYPRITEREAPQRVADHFPEDAGVIRHAQKSTPAIDGVSEVSLGGVLARLGGREGHAGGGGGAVAESQLGEMVVVVEQAPAAAEHEWVDHQQVFVDQTVGHQRADQLAAAHDHEVAAVELGQSSFVSELLEATYLGALLSASLNGPPLGVPGGQHLLVAAPAQQQTAAGLAIPTGVARR
jgi:hypothetical protein